MTKKDVAQLQLARPFRPFKLFVYDTSFSIRGPEYMWIKPEGDRTLVVSDGNRLQMIDMHHITRYEMEDGGDIEIPPPAEEDRSLPMEGA